MGPGGRKAAYAVVAIHLGSQAENAEGGWEFIKHTVIGDLQEIWVPQGGGRYPADLRREPITTKDYEDASVYKTMASIANATPTLIQQGDFNDIWRNETWPAILEGAINGAGSVTEDAGSSPRVAGRPRLSLVNGDMRSGERDSLP